MFRVGNRCPAIGQTRVASNPLHGWPTRASWPSQQACLPAWAADSPLQYELGRDVVVRLLVAVLCIAGIADGSTGAEDLRAIKDLQLDPDRCFRVRDVFLQREDAKFFFTDGHLIFAKPVLGRVVAALFLATDPSDTGELLLMPPDPAERQSTARFLGETILNEKFRNAMLFFTDDTAEELDAAIRESPGSRLDPEVGARIAPRWSIVLRNLIELSAGRALVDLYSGRPAADGFFVAAVRGRSLGRFDVVVDPTMAEQVVAGQLVRSGGKAYYEVWCRFQARSVRDGRREPAKPVAQLQDYRIEARLGDDLYMQVKTTATLVPHHSGARAIGFDISDKLEMTAVRIDGEEVEFLQSRQPEATGRDSDGTLVIAVLPEPMLSGENRQMEFDYRGKVVSDAGSGVYSVADRTNWYPRTGNELATYDLSFRYPARLDLVATGSRVADFIDGGMRVSRFDSGKPIRLAGFNLGDYASASRDVDGFRVEVRATKKVEPRLQAPRVPVLIPQTTLPSSRRNRSQPTVLVLPRPPVESPAIEIERIADESAAAFAFFLRRFGEPAMPVTVISPVPGDFGQGFPGLVYASTRSYFQRGDRPLRNLSPGTQRFYADLLRPHEISHQWWGNVVYTPFDRDGWLMEALATYSSLLWLEEKRGAGERDEVLGGFLQNLIRKSDGQSVESAGPVVMGRRLRTAKLPEAYSLIVYEKGAWIMHMLRGFLGDDGFLALLRALCDQRGSEAVTTESFRELAAGFVPADYHDPSLRDFFDQWVYGTGVPRLAVEWDQDARGGQHHFNLRLVQSGVSDYFPVHVAVEVHTLPGRSLVKHVLVGDGSDDPGFSVVLRNAATRVVIDPDGWLLAEKP